MSVLINGMEMPSGCLSCDFCNPFVDEPYCRRLMRRTPKVKRLEDCPLVELPPHGRLIDADALAEDLDFDVENDQRALDQMDFVGKERERIQFDKDCKQNCMWYLSEAHTIIEAEEGE